MNEKKCRRWTQEEIDYVRMFAEDPDGDNCITVAMYLGRTASAVRGKVHQLRKEGTQIKLLDKWSDWEINALKRMSGKMTVKEQARLLGRSYHSVCHKRSDLGIPNVPSQYGKEIRKLAHQGLFRKEIARKLRLNYSSLCHYITREGIPCLVDEEGRLQGITDKIKYHNQLMSWAFYKEGKNG